MKLISVTSGSGKKEGLMIVGIDDTDSKTGMCTTYLCAVLVDELRGYGTVSIPRLVRLNPCIPYKTRGNGAVAFEITLHKTSDEEAVKDLTKARVGELAEVHAKETNPGVVFIRDQSALRMPSEHLQNLQQFYELAVKDIVTIEHAFALLAELEIEHYGLKQKRGVIGALAAAAFFILQRRYPAHYDVTYELIAYRKRERWGTPRVIDTASVWKADSATYPLTWDTVDYKNKNLVLAPHSPCPVLFGIRGGRVDAVMRAYEIITAESVERETLFITNQGTDSHLIPGEELQGSLSDYHSYRIEGTVMSKPRAIEGGHVVFQLAIAHPNEERIDCIAYEPTKQFREIVRNLWVGDEVTAYGSFKTGTLNLEKIAVRAVIMKAKRNPRCEICGKRMKSAGGAQGYRCKRCGTFRSSQALETVERELAEGLYEVPPVARRHIAKPLIRLRNAGSQKIHPSR
ncbi:MAG: TiaS agmantine-binding domain-containing protein [Candidatus Methanospirareceae archaeon]